MDAVSDVGRTLRSGFSTESLVSSRTNSLPNPLQLGRISVLPSGVFPYLRRLDTGDVTLSKKVLLTLQLSSPSFLNSVLSEEGTQHPLYNIKTHGTSTSITRTDLWESSSRAADLKWPKTLSENDKARESEGVMVMIGGGRWKLGSAILRPGTFARSPKKFYIPGYSRSLKWKVVGNAYWCVSSTAKGPIATFKPASKTTPAQLKVFETLHDKYDTHLLVHQGVSVLLLDYLVLTSLLLVTDIQEWMLVREHDPDTNHDGLPRSAPSYSVSAQQLRKIIYGEPLFPGRTSSSFPSFPPTPTGSHFFRSSSQGSVITSFDDEDDDEDGEYGDDNESTAAELPVNNLTLHEQSGPPSPSQESIYYTSTAPSHNHMDPMFYVPPVPAIPSQYASSSATASQSSSPVGSRRIRELPRLPVKTYPPRSQSTPPQDLGIERSEPISTAIFRSTSRPRQLPTPPIETNSGNSSPKRLSMTALGRRSLPPTPTVSRPTTSNGEPVLHLWKDSWSTLPPIPLLFSAGDVPPPAYNTINFGSSYGMLMTGSPPSPPISPPPPLE